MGGYSGAGGGGSQADAQWRSPAPASSGASAPSAQGSSKRTWSGQVRVIEQSIHAELLGPCTCTCVSWICFMVRSRWYI